MADNAEEQELASTPDRRDHMANERTFLAWVRTSISIMVFGFVVEKFALFLNKLTLLVEKKPLSPSSIHYSSIMAIVLVAMGAVIGFLAFIRYKKVEREINEGTFQPSIILDVLVAMGILTIGVFLALYMMHSI